MSDPQPQRDERPFILIADDDPDTLDLLKFLCENKGWRVDTATTAREIIDKVNYHCSEVGQCYDAILSDVNFFDNQPGPRLSGISALARIRERWNHIPVVFFSAFLNTVLRDQISELGNAVALEKSGRVGDPNAGDAVSAVERVEMALQWSGRKGRAAAATQSSCAESVEVHPALQSALEEARLLREIHSIGSLGKQEA